MDVDLWYLIQLVVVDSHLEVYSAEQAAVNLDMVHSHHVAVEMEVPD